MKEKEKKILREIRKMRRKGKTIAEIALKLGRSMNYVYQRINKKYYPKKLRD